MCGICGIWNKRNEPLLTEMMQLLKHRGPDADGRYVRKHCALGHVRLSIMDPAGGDQPIPNENNTKVVLANGEIYNFPQLAKRLKDTHVLKTGNDSEAVLHLFEDKGQAVTDELDGMFAFCIADEHELFLARDYIGIKPLYLSQEDDGALYFSSEMKNLLHTTGRITEFPPGTSYHSRHGFRTFYEVPEPRVMPATEEKYLALLRTTLNRSIEKRLMSDVPLGTFLSGGLDSSLISALTRKHLSPLHTFSVGIEGSRDLEHARLVSGHIGSIHHNYTLSPEEVARKLPEIIYHLESYDMDLIRSAIPCYFTSRMASDYVKVILTGEGADELFGGYTYYKDVHQDILSRELRRSVSSLHNINLQRVDRLTMAHGLEGRVPFLDREMIDLAFKIPATYKIQGEPPVEKWILRKAFEDVLPPPVLWRKKEQFDEGSGTVDLLGAMIPGHFSDADAAAHMKKHPACQIRCKEEAYYHKLFIEVFPKHAKMQDNVARWAQRPPEIMLPGSSFTN